MQFFPSEQCLHLSRWTRTLCLLTEMLKRRRPVTFHQRNESLEIKRWNFQTKCYHMFSGIIWRFNWWYPLKEVVQSFNVQISFNQLMKKYPALSTGDRNGFRPPTFKRSCFPSQGIIDILPSAVLIFLECDTEIVVDQRVAGDQVFWCFLNVDFDIPVDYLWNFYKCLRLTGSINPDFFSSSPPRHHFSIFP